MPGRLRRTLGNVDYTTWNANDLIARVRDGVGVNFKFNRGDAQRMFVELMAGGEEELQLPVRAVIDLDEKAPDYRSALGELLDIIDDDPELYGKVMARMSEENRALLKEEE